MPVNQTVILIIERILINGFYGVLMNTSADQARNQYDFLVRLRNLCIQFCMVSKHFQHEPTIGNDLFPIAHQHVVGFQERRPDFIFRQMWGCTFVLAIEFGVATPDHLAVLVGGMPDFLSEESTAIGADQLG